MTAAISGHLLSGSAKGTDVDPNVESCDSSTVDEERQYRTFINIMDGLRPSVQIVDKNNDGLYNSLDLNVSRVKVSKGSHTLIAQKNKIADIDTKNDKEMLAHAEQSAPQLASAALSAACFMRKNDNAKNSKKASP
jgi:hypothetical protein